MRRALPSAVLLAALACAHAPLPDRVQVATQVFRAPPAHAGAERYSAWFADSDGRVLYFGLSPFWELWWASGGDALADLAEPGDHLIGRFDLYRERFLEPLRVRAGGPEVRSSVWDVLVHSSGRIFYTTFYEEAGSVLPDGSDVRHFEGLGPGLNELAEGPGGNVYATRYSPAPREQARPGGSGSIVVLSPDGRLLREHYLPRSPDRFVAPKSLAVGPRGHVYVNTDTFLADGSVRHERFVLGPDGIVRLDGTADHELLFVAVDRRGRVWRAEDVAGVLRVSVQGRRETARWQLGPRDPLDFVQDIRFTPWGGALLALWSGRVLMLEPDSRGRLRLHDLALELPPDCAPPKGRSLLYTAVARPGALYATLACGATVLRVPLPVR